MVGTSDANGIASGDMSARYIDVQLTTLDQLGFARARALDVLGVTHDQIDNPRLRLPLDDVVRLYDEASDALSHPNLGLEVGYGFRVAGFEKSGRIYAFCRDLVEVVRTNARYQKIAVDAGRVTFLEESGEDRRAFLDFDPHYGDAEGFRHITELIFGSYGTAFSWLSWGSGKGNKAVHLRHAEPTDTALHAKVFECPVHFGAPRNRMEYHPDMIREPLATADPDRLALTKARLDRILTEIGRDPNREDSHEGGLRDGLVAAIRLCMRRGQLTLACVSDVMERPERRLRSDIKAAGLKYRDVVDATRQEVFHELSERGDSFAAIAQALGYNDQAAFTRAFRRWYGCSPSAYDGRDAKNGMGPKA